MNFLRDIPFLKSNHRKEACRRFRSIYELVNASDEVMVEVFGDVARKLLHLINVK